jgi:MFS family permease
MASDPYAAWRSSSFRLYALGWFLLTFGRQIETVAIGVYLWNLTHDPLALGWLGLIQALPVMLLALPAGQLADRFDRRRVMMVMLAVGTCVSVGLALAVRQTMPLGWFYLLLALDASTAAAGGPARAALLPQILPADQFTNAVTWSSSIFQIASMTGPAVGGLVIGTENHIAAALGVVVACRLGSLLAIAGVRLRPQKHDRAAISWRNLVAGIRFVWHSKLILATITLDLFAVLLGGATYLLPIYAEEILHVGAQGLGFLRSAEAVGAISMAVLLAHLPPMRRAGRTMLLAVAGFGVATIVFGVSTWFWLSLAMMFLIGALDNISVVVRHTLVQMLAPDAMRGRVSAVNSVFIVSSNDLGGMESGVLARLFGPVAAVVIGGVGAIVVVLTWARMWPEILGIGRLTDVRPAELVKAQVAEEAEQELADRV